ncbi:hypothetical protein BDA99DRAFT_565857 [Phascolomyces articulosus]|uniref:CCHC-type domain-containing protein n=1 Tax=Phascolomyces articulosus TaxID=60185 RepID=A0AAD5P955_9FUNG|nr:hypothetical protein BDA99DRAFT_565857 [Phascolomyces articulosus]
MLIVTSQPIHQQGFDDPLVTPVLDRIKAQDAEFNERRSTLVQVDRCTRVGNNDEKDCYNCGGFGHIARFYPSPCRQVIKVIKVKAGLVQLVSIRKDNDHGSPIDIIVRCCQNLFRNMMHGIDGTDYKLRRDTMNDCYANAPELGIKELTSKDTIDRYARFGARLVVSLYRLYTDRLSYHPSRFKPVRLVTPAIVILMYWCRLLVMTKIKANPLTSNPPYLPNSNKTMRLASTAAGDEPRMPTIFWRDTNDFTELVMANSNILIILSHLQLCYENLIESMASQLRNPLYTFGIPDPILIINKIIQANNGITDSIGKTDIGYSFLSDDKNQMKAYQHSLLTNLLANSNTRKANTANILSDGSIEWNTDQIRRWLARGGKFQK